MPYWLVIVTKSLEFILYRMSGPSLISHNHWNGKFEKGARFENPRIREKKEKNETYDERLKQVKSTKNQSRFKDNK